MDKDRLHSIPLFASLGKRERRTVARCADEVDLRPGKELVREGDWSYEFFAIERGTAEVVRDGECLAELGPGDFFGEMGVIEDTRRNASVIATSQMTAIVMTGRDLRRIAREMPVVAERIRRAARERAASIEAGA